jgi:hypothetical protein
VPQAYKVLLEQRVPQEKMVQLVLAVLQAMTGLQENRAPQAKMVPEVNKEYKANRVALAKKVLEANRA